MINRRALLEAGVTLAAAPVLSAQANRISLKPVLSDSAAPWTFVGSPDWSHDAGILYSPVWNHRKAKKTDLLKREDFAYPSGETLDDTDLSVEFRLFSWSVTDAGLIFRAQDSVRFYCVQLYDLERKGPKYSVRLFVQDASGYRRDIASGFAPHRELPERIVQTGPKPEEWETATPGWANVRVRAEGERIRVFVDGKLVVEAKDSTYRAGRAGIVARGPVTFRNLALSGTRATRSTAWTAVPGERPAYFYPYPDTEKRFGDNQTYPGICRTVEGHLLVWMSVRGDPHGFHDFLLVRSRDEGKNWGEPVLVSRLPDGGKPGFFFGHRDGRISCLFVYEWNSRQKGPKRAFSSDGGRTWTRPEPLVVSGKPLHEIPTDGDIGPYSPISRLSDGTLLQFFYHVQTVKGGNVGSNAERRDRSLIIRSTDDGKTWTGPHYLDPSNFDSNETMGAERADGSLIAFSRTLRAPFMWASVSRDGGLTWSRQTPSDCTGECPYLLRHSSGVLLMGSRGAGIFMKTSVDEGRSWSRETRISLCSGMMGMTELKDGRVLVVFHEAYRTPTRIRAQYLRVRKDGCVDAG
ncbi:MAG: sialidase family protein [Bryobacteraceae bacterium]